MTAWHGTAMVYGPPASMGSKRIGRAGKDGRPLILDVKDAALRAFQAELCLSMRGTAPPAPVRGPVGVQIVLWVPRPRGHFGTGRNAAELKPSAPSRPPAGRDVDKVARACLDAGKPAGWWWDDQQVCSLRVERFYADGGETVRTGVAAWEL